MAAPTYMHARLYLVFISALSRLPARHTLREAERRGGADVRRQVQVGTTPKQVERPRRRHDVALQVVQGRDPVAGRAQPRGHLIRS